VYYWPAPIIFIKSNNCIHSDEEFVAEMIKFSQVQEDHIYERAFWYSQPYLELYRAHCVESVANSEGPKKHSTHHFLPSL
jgi:hypothetical protein